MSKLEQAREEDKKLIAYLKKQVEEAREEDKKLREELHAVKEEMAQLKGAQEEVQKEKEESKQRLYHLEKKNISANLILRNVQQEEDETKEQVEDKVKDFLKAIKVEEDVQVASVVRFRKAADAKGDRPPAILVKLKDARMKGTIYKNIHRLKDTNLNKLTVSNEYPAALRPLIKELEHQAYKIRKDSNKKTRTRVEVKNGKAVLMVKPEGQAEFKPV